MGQRGGQRGCAPEAGRSDGHSDGAMRVDTDVNVAGTVLLATELGPVLRISFCAPTATKDSTTVLLVSRPLPLLRIPVLEALFGPQAGYAGNLWP